MKKIRLTLLVVATIAITTNNLLAQISGVISGQDTTRRAITTAVPFVSFAPDSRGSGMGDVGVATSADANSVHWNNAKLAFVDHTYGLSISYSPWLGNIVPDMSLYYLSGYYKIDRVQSIGVSLRYFDLGTVLLTDMNNISLGENNPTEGAVDVTYSRKLSEKLGIGVTTRYIWSNLVGPISGVAKIGTSVAIDLGVYYTNNIALGSTDADLSFGGHISNIGQKVTYTVDEDANFIPINLRVGTALKLFLDPYNTLTFALDLNKLMVPTPPVYELDEDGQIQTDPDTGKKIIKRGDDPDRNLISGMFGSFSDAPDGFSEEMQEIMISAGAEYWYKELFAVRTGYFFEHVNKGGRQYFTLGVGFRYQKFGIDFSYLIPGDQNHPLAETIRFSLLWNLDKAESSDVTN